MTQLYFSLEQKICFPDPPNHTPRPCKSCLLSTVNYCCPLHCIPH